MENGWIQDGVFVTDIPEGVDGGFLSADMARIAMMAGLLIDVLSDLLPDEPATAGSSSAVDRATEERVRAIIGEEAIKASIAETFESVLQEIHAAKEDALGDIEDAMGDIEDAIGDIKDALMDAKDESPNR